jgi:hypothetical protein
MRYVTGIVATASGLALSCGALGQTWAEQGDAGDLPSTAQVCDGSGPLAGITGLITLGDADMYKIRIVDEAAFVATTVDLATWDTQLFLFDLNGQGIALNDDHVGGTTLRSTLTTQFVTVNGDYLLAISGYDRDPHDASNALIWNNTPFREERAPDGPGAANPVASWSDAFTPFNEGTYEIRLTGCEFVGATCYPDCDTSTGVGVLDIFDFLCFQNRYDAGSAYACDCDTSTGGGVCDIFDFLCFQNEFSNGCP